MNRFGQTALYMMFGLGLFGIVFYGGFASVVSTYGQDIVLNNDLTGLQGFFFSNINLVITIFYIFALLAVGRMGFG